MKKILFAKRCTIFSYQLNLRLKLSLLFTFTFLMSVKATSNPPINVLHNHIFRVKGTVTDNNSNANFLEIASSDFQNTVQGVVLDETGQPIPNTNVIVKGTTQGTIADFDGNYSIVVDGNVTLVFTSIGFISQEISVANQTTINVTLTTDTQTLDEVVVMGYGTQKKSTLTGAVGSISASDFESQPLAGLDQAMKGQVAGVQVSQTSGTPGGGTTVRIRGTGSIGAGNEPLYVIDGFPVSGSYDQNTNPLTSINPNDIASIEILKDASAAAIYGSRGANGVVIITTKRGKEGKSGLRFSAFSGGQEIAHKIDMLNAREYAEFNTLARNNRWVVDMGGDPTVPNSERPGSVQIPPMFANPESLGEGTDWQDEIFRFAPIQSYELSTSGGNDKTQFYISGGYFNQKGIVINTGYERYSARINLDTKLYDKLKLGVSLTPSYEENQIRSVEGNQFANGILASALAIIPGIPVRNPDGTFTSQMESTPYTLGIIENPVAIAEKAVSGAKSLRALGTAYAELSLLTDLKLKISLGADYSSGMYSTYHPSDLGKLGGAAPTQASASSGNNTSITWLNENTLTYDKSIKDVHNVNAVVGFTSQKSRYDGIYLSAINFPNDLVQTLNAGQVSSGGTRASEWSLLSYLGRVNYNYKEKYLFSGTVRADGSSRFGEEKKWGTFPSGSIGWEIAKEKFLQNQNYLNILKIRASYGLAGNNDIGNYSQVGLLSPRDYVFGPDFGVVNNGLYQSTLSNDDLGWEVSNQLDIGLDLAFFGNRIAVIADYYNKNTSDLLLNVPIPASMGFTNTLQNIGKVNNTGWEFTLSTLNFVRQFKWSTDFNISFNENEIIALGPSGAPINGFTPGMTPASNISEVGSPLGMFWGYKSIGIYQTQQEIDESPAFPSSVPGDLKFEDVNGDGIISSEDRTIIGSPYPDFIYGITNNFSYKNLSLNVQIQGEQGLERLNGSRRNVMYISGSYSRRDVLGSWQSPENPGDGKTPRATTAASNGNVANLSSFLIEDASYLRIRNINLNYQLPENLLKTISLQSASIYLNVQNAFTFTKYEAYNPEQSINGANPLAPGVDFNGYPIARIFTLGLNVNF